MNLNLEIGDIVELTDGAKFFIISTDYIDEDLDGDGDYKYEGKCFLSSREDIEYWTVGEIASWTEDGIFNLGAIAGVHNIIKVYTRKNEPEHFL